MNQDFLIERYKYILEQKRELNKATFIVVGIFQAIIAAIVLAHYTILIQLSENKLPLDIALSVTKWLSVSFLVLGIFCEMLIVGGIISWLGYRSDEAEIEFIVHGQSRAAPRWKDVLGWYETYIVISILITEIGYFYGIYCKFLPMMIAM